MQWGICLELHLLTASEFKGTSMGIHWEVLQLHGTLSRDSEPERTRQEMKCAKRDIITMITAFTVKHNPFLSVVEEEEVIVVVFFYCGCV